MQQNDQDISFNGLQLINQNLLSPACLQSVSNFSNVVINPQGQFMVGNGNSQPSMQAMLLNPQNLLLNQQLMNQQQASSLGQFLPQNQLIATSGQQIYLANIGNIGNFYTSLNNGNQKNGQMPMQTIVMAPTGLIPSTAIIGTIPNGQQKVSSRKSGTKKSSSKSSGSSRKVSKKQKRQSVKSRYLPGEQDSDDEMYQQDEVRQESQANTDVETEDEEMVEQESLGRNCQVGQIKNIYARIEESDEEESDEEMVHDLDDLESMASDANTSDDEDSLSETSFNDDDDKFSMHSGMSSLPDLSCVKKEKVETNVRRNVRYSAKDIAELSEQEREALRSELRAFAKEFKMFRAMRNMTQETVSRELSTYTKCSQSKLCRFEKYGRDTDRNKDKTLDVLNDAKKLSSALVTMQIMRKYMLMKMQKIAEMGETSANKTRKRRTNFKQETVQILTEFFRQNQHPRPDEIKQLAKQTGYEFQEIKVWFNNKRQSSKQQSGSSE